MRRLLATTGLALAILAGALTYNQIGLADDEPPAWLTRFWSARRANLAVFLAPLLSSTSPVMRPAGTAVTTTRATTATLEDANVTPNLSTVAANTGRYHSTKGLLSEAAATNLLLRSEELENASWADLGTPTVTANTWDFGTGSSTGDTITDDDGAGREGRIQTNGATATGVYTCSCYVASGTLTAARIGTFATGAGTGSTNCDFTGLSASSTRKTCSATIGGTPTGIQCAVYPGTSTAETGSIKVGGCQLETGSVATSYIPTAGSTVTRNADVHTVPTTGFPTTSGEVSLKFTALVSAAPSVATMLFDSRNAGTQNGVFLSRGTDNKVTVRIYGSAAQVCATTTTAAVDWSALRTIEGQWTPTTCDILIDGVVAATTGTGSGSPVQHRSVAFIGADVASGSQSNGWIRDLCVGRPGSCP